MTDTASLSLALEDEIATANMMADIAMLVGAGDVITLSGDLGAGKTAAARAMIRYLASDDELEVPSPTFTLVQSYELPSCSLIHADLYRLNSPAELEEIELSPLPEDVLALIEWPERAGTLLPADRIDIALNHQPSRGSSARIANITGHGKAAAVVNRLGALRAFIDGARHHDSKRLYMAGDASTRSYARLIQDGHSWILMNMPRKPEGNAIYDGKTYHQAVHLAEDVKPFLAIANALRAQGISAPAIRHADLEDGFLITEDFGSEPVVRGTPPLPITERYEAATDLLAHLHGIALPDVLPLTPGITYRIPTFDIDVMLFEVRLLIEWYFPDQNIAISDDDRDEFFAIWRDILGGLEGMQRTWMIRDYHSPNLIWLDDREGIAKVGVIDLQDAVMGPPAYDLVSLLQDARVDASEELEFHNLSRYIETRFTNETNFDPGRFAASYAVMSAQRNTRLLGTFARLNMRDGKPQYLKHQPRIWSYLRRSLAHPELARLHLWFSNHFELP